jgi:hypothetical protein
MQLAGNKVDCGGIKKSDASDDGLALHIQSNVLRQGLEVWNGLRGDRKMPAPGDIDPLGFPPSILCHIALLDIVGQSDIRFRWRLLGTHITTVIGRDMTGRYWDEIYPPSILARISVAPRQVMETLQPYLSVGSAIHVDKDYLHRESLHLPLSNDGEQVDRILVVMEFSTGHGA